MPWFLNLGKSRWPLPILKNASCGRTRRLPGMMADTDAPAAAAKGGLEFLTKKIGPLPVVVWIGLGLAILWYLDKQKSAAASANATPNQQTDPAGNVGSIDPA